MFRCILNISNFKEGIHSDGSLLKEILGSELKQTDRLERVKQALKFFFFFKAARYYGSTLRINNEPVF